MGGNRDSVFADSYASCLTGVVGWLVKGAPFSLRVGKILYLRIHSAVDVCGIGVIALCFIPKDSIAGDVVDPNDSGLFIDGKVEHRTWG